MALVFDVVHHLFIYSFVYRFLFFFFSLFFCPFVVVVSACCCLCVGGGGVRACVRACVRVFTIFFFWRTSMVLGTCFPPHLELCWEAASFFNRVLAPLSIKFHVTVWPLLSWSWPFSCWGFPGRPELIESSRRDFPFIFIYGWWMLWSFSSSFFSLHFLFHTFCKRRAGWMVSNDGLD